MKQMIHSPSHHVGQNDSMGLVKKKLAEKGKETSGLNLRREAETIAKAWTKHCCEIISMWNGGWLPAVAVMLPDLIHALVFVGQ